ncbi:MAG: hypothetical protein ACRBI6_14405 [Acidimicrobiales bacterium]
MTEKQSQVLGLGGFIVAGLLFIVAGVRAGDWLTLAGSALWTVSCVIWLIPLLRTPSD